MSVREFGQTYACRPREVEYVKERAWLDVNRMVELINASCVDASVTDIEVLEGPRLDILNRYSTVGWRFHASSPTFDFAYRYLQRPAVEETLWQHAKRAWKAWWGRQRGRAT